MATAYYVTQSGTSPYDGSAAHPWRASDFNTAGNWSVSAGTSGKISPADTVHLGGTISTTLTVQGNGLSGQPITILWDSGAKLSQAASTLMNLNSKSYLVINGDVSDGQQGIIECTANGTVLANHNAVQAIIASGSSNITIKNLTVQNIYVHTSVTDTNNTGTYVASVYANGYGANFVIQNCTFTETCWAIEMFGSTGASLDVNHCTFTNYDHGIGGVANGGGSMGVFSATYNHFGSTANWDTTANAFHHDGIHLYWGGGNGLANAVIANNLFDGDWGANNTAHIFLELNWTTHDAAEFTNPLICNNVCIEYAGNLLNNGFMNYRGTNGTIANNTFLGSSVTNSIGVRIPSGSGTIFKDNIIEKVNMFVWTEGTPFAASGLNNNIYFSQAAGGNGPFNYNGVTKTFATWKTATGQDAASITTDPALGSDGSISAGSVAIGAGANLTSLGFGILNTSYNNLGRPVSAAWDTGAYQYAASGPTVSSATIQSSGTSTIIVLSASTSNGADLSGMKITVDLVDYTLTYSSGSGSASLTYTHSKIYQGASGTNDYAQSGTGLSATAGGALVNTYSGLSLTNNSTQVLPAPTGPNALHTGSSTIDVSWTDNSLGITSFIIYRSLTDSSYLQVGTAAAGVTTYSDSSLASGTTYYYKIASTFQGVVSSQTSSVNATTTGGGAPSKSGTLGKVGLLGGATLI